MSQAWTIFGTGAHARKVAHCALRAGDSVVVFVDENPAARSPLPGVPVSTAAAWAASAANGGVLFVAIGRADVRRRVMDDAAGLGWRLPPLLHPMRCWAKARWWPLARWWKAAHASAAVPSSTSACS